MRRCFCLLLAACGTSPVVNDGGVDGGPNDAASDAHCSVPATDASFNCDVSSVAPADLACADWVGQATVDDAGGTSCPASFGWSGGGGGGACEYKWLGSKPPDLCKLPPNNGYTPFAWLHAQCGSGCALGDAGAPPPCTTSNDCSSTQYCQLGGNCAAPGACYPIQGVGAPGQVCGCDKQTYANGGAAHQARVSIAYAGACE